MTTRIQPLAPEACEQSTVDRLKHRAAEYRTQTEALAKRAADMDALAEFASTLRLAVEVDPDGTARVIVTVPPIQLDPEADKRLELYCDQGIESVLMGAVHELVQRIKAASVAP